MQMLRGESRRRYKNRNDHGHHNHHAADDHLRAVVGGFVHVFVVDVQRINGSDTVGFTRQRGHNSGGEGGEGESFEARTEQVEQHGVRFVGFHLAGGVYHFLLEH